MCNWFYTYPDKPDFYTDRIRCIYDGCLDPKRDCNTRWASPKDFDFCLYTAKELLYEQEKTGITDKTNYYNYITDGTCTD